MNLPPTLIFLLTLILYLTGCDVFLQTEEEVVIKCPEVPSWAAVRFGFPRFLIRYSKDGSRCEIPAESQEVRVTLPLGTCIPLLAEPMFNDPSAVFSPAGGLYPADMGRDGKLQLTWMNGFAAETLQILEAGGLRLGEFNSIRFFREVEIRGKGNPWALDRNKIADALSALSFRADRIVMKPGFSVFLDTKGLWMPGNLLGMISRESDDERGDFGILTEGFHRYYGEKGGVLSIFIGPSGDLIYRESGNGSALYGLSQ